MKQLTTIKHHAGNNREVRQTLFSHAQKTLAWDAFAFTEVLLTQPVMVVVGEKVGAFGAYRDGLEVYGRAMVSQDRQLVSLPDFSTL